MKHFFSWKIRLFVLWVSAAYASTSCTFTSAFSLSPIRTDGRTGSKSDAYKQPSRWSFTPKSFTSAIPNTTIQSASCKTFTQRHCTRLFLSSKPPPPDFFKGAPSTPGFKPGQFDKLTSWAMSTDANRPIVSEYDPDGLWLWTQWEGT